MMMRFVPVRPAAVACIFGVANLLIACSGEVEDLEHTNSQQAPQAKSVTQVVETNRVKSLDNHIDHSHHQVAIESSNLVAQPVRLKKPGPPSYADQFDGQYRLLSERSAARSGSSIAARTPATRDGGDCVIDFATPNLTSYLPGAAPNGTVTHWADRTYIPWLKDCGSGSRLDLRQSKYSHFHVGFAGSDFTFCGSDVNLTPAYINDDGSCDFLDINTLERTYATTHRWDEVLVLRAYFQYSSDSAPFDLKRLRIVREAGARVCYRKADEANSEGPWIEGSGGGTGTNPSTAGGWYCWNHLDQGTWDLSAWADNVVRVKMTGSARTHSTFAIDDIHAQLH